MRRRKLYIFLTIVITLWSQASCNSNDSTSETAQKADPAAIAKAVDEAEALFKQRGDVSKLRDAVALLGKARVDNPRTFDLEWRFSKFNYFLGKQTKDEKAAEKIFTTG